MIKYARTKDGKIIKVNTENDVFTSKYKIVKQANTIEELFNIFVYVNNKNSHTFIADFQIKKYLEFDGIIYAAIWTDEGLIYKAKTNKERKFELI